MGGPSSPLDRSLRADLESRVWPGNARGVRAPDAHPCSRLLAIGDVRLLPRSRRHTPGARAQIPGVAPRDFRGFPRGGQVSGGWVRARV